ncbi:hypothetical protein CIP107578_00743 [Corynebacterium diphtheriae]|nr:hypothetical protein CIP107558_00741 [Corynebacterium diphtheriae]CAB0639838.1 hypothetical protein CIP107578_00743 [Corynebacterium diphtheriae]
MTMTTTIREDYPTCDEHPTLSGKQTPLYLREAPGVHEHGRKNIELARRAGMKAFPWQVHEINAINATNPDGSWTHSDAVLICPRQNGKSLLVALIVMYRIFVLGQNVLFTAQRWDTAKELWEHTWKLVKGRKFLMKLVVSKSCSQGRGTIFLSNGGRVVFTTRSQDAGRGLTKVDLMIYDEAYNLTDAEIAALVFLTNAAPDPQVFYMTSSVHRDFPQHQNGQVISAMRKQALEEWDPDDPMYFAEYAAPDDLDPEDEQTWRIANPSYGVIANAKKMKNIMRRMNTESGRINFGVEALGWGLWFDDEAVDEFKPIFTDEQLDAAFTTEHVELLHTVLAVDATPDREWCSIAAGGRTRSGGVHGVVGYHGPLNTQAATEAVLQAVRDADPVAIIIDPKSAAWVIADAIRDAGFDVTEMKFSHVKAAASKLLHGVDERTWSFGESKELRESFAVAELQEDKEGGVRLTRSSGVLSPLVAVDFAMWGVHEYAPLPKAVVPDSSGVKMRMVKSRHESFAF